MLMAELGRSVADVNKTTRIENFRNTLSDKQLDFQLLKKLEKLNELVNEVDKDQKNIVDLHKQGFLINTNLQIVDRYLKLLNKIVPDEKQLNIEVSDRKTLIIKDMTGTKKNET